MSTSSTKRRRLDEAAKTLRKPFKPPFRTPLKPGIGSDPPSSDPPDMNAPIHVETLSRASAEDWLALTPTVLQEQSLPSCVSFKYPLKPVVPRQTPSVPSQGLSNKRSTKTSLTRDIMQLRNETQMLSQAHALAMSTTDEELVFLITRWRSASRAAAEELFGITRDRVNKMGGVGAWIEREKANKERQREWDREEMGTERKKMEQALESGEIPQEVYDKYMEIGEEHVEEEQEPPSEQPNTDSFTMDMMLKTLNIDLKLIGYSKEMQRWDS